MKTSEVNTSLIGKKVEIMVTGLMVKGIVTAIYECKHSKGIVVNHEPVNWGSEIYTTSTSISRKSDDWGNLEYAKLI